jgi:hypothetical protein
MSRARTLLGLVAVLCALRAQESRPESRPGSPSVAARRALAAALANEGLVDGAIAADREALAILLANDSAKPNHVATARGELAVLYYRQNQLVEALSVCHDVIATADANHVRDRVEREISDSRRSGRSVRPSDASEREARGAEWVSNSVP